jgi:hypothetical protein
VSTVKRRDDNVLYHSQSWAQARITCLAYLAEKPVVRPLAENTDQLKWLNERFGLFSTVKQMISKHKLRGGALQIQH